MESVGLYKMRDILLVWRTFILFEVIIDNKTENIENAVFTIEIIYSENCTLS